MSFGFLDEDFLSQTNWQMHDFKESYAASKNNFGKKILIKSYQCFTKEVKLPLPVIHSWSDWANMSRTSNSGYIYL